MIRFFILFFLSVVVCKAQTATDKKNTLPVENATNTTTSPTPTSSPKQFLKVIFDDSNSQLIGIDTSGNVLENVIIAFQLFVTIKGISHSEQALGSSLNKAMRDLLTQVEQNTILYFEHIQVKNKAGNIVEADDFQYTLSYLPKQKQ